MPAQPQPYIGPRPYERHEAGLFAGRDRESDYLLALVRAHPLVLLVGESGCGKTSLVNAGLTPLLTREGADVMPLARTLRRAPHADVAGGRSNPFARSVCEAWCAPPVDAGTAAPGSITDALRHRRQRAAGDAAFALKVAIIDQAEELCCASAPAADAAELLAQVWDALSEDPHLRVILVVRSESAPALEALVGSPAAGSRAHCYLERLRREDARMAVLKPAATVGIGFAPGAAEKLIDDLLTVRLRTTGGRVQVLGEFVDPLHLQLVSRAMCRSLEYRLTIHPEDIPEVDEAELALRRFVDGVVREAASSFGLAEEHLRRWIRREFVSADGARAQIAHESLSGNGAPSVSLEKLADLALLRWDDVAGGRRYELAHDRLVPVILESDGEAAVAGVRASDREARPSHGSDGAGTEAGSGAREPHGATAAAGQRPPSGYHAPADTTPRPFGEHPATAGSDRGSGAADAQTSRGGEQGTSEHAVGAGATVRRPAYRPGRASARRTAGQVLLPAVALLAFTLGSFGARMWLRQSRLSASPGGRTATPIRPVDPPAGGPRAPYASLGSEALPLATRADDMIRSGDVLGAVAALRQALAQEQRRGSSAGEAAILAQLGAAYAARGNTGDALYCYSLGAARARAAGDQAMAARLFRTTGDVYSARGAIPNGIDCYRQALAVEQARRDAAAECLTLAGIGRLYGLQRRFQDALRYYSQSLDAARRMRDRGRQAEILTAMADVSAASGAPVTAADLRKQAKALRR